MSLFGKKVTMKDQLRDTDRQLRRTGRDLERDRREIERDEKKLVINIIRIII